MTSASLHLKHLTNWVGFVFFGVWACLTLSKMPAAGIMLAPTFLMEIAAAISFLIRDEPKLENRTARARFSAYTGSFFMLVVLYFAQRSHPEWFAPRISVLTPLAIGLWLAGSVWTAYAIWHLRRAFSIEPAARRLITSGPYSVARHPVYTGYFAQYIGLFMTIPSFAVGLALLLWAAMMIDRMYLEEAVLRAAFPEYVDYKRRVGALGPKLVRRTTRPAPAVSV
jgi:protein-S-isoprenylcysteine O-methyltransferase Ste14